MSARKFEPVALHAPRLEPAAPEGRRKTIRVLIVENDPDSGKLFAGAVRGLGLTPHLALDLHGAREFLARRQARLVLLDRQLGEFQDGLDLCLELKKAPRTRLVPVIVVNGRDAFSEEIKCIRHGADLYLRRPVDLSRLRKYVAAFLGRLPYEETGSNIRYGPVAVSKADHTIRVGQIVYRNLPEKQFDLLALLVSRQGGTVSRRFLIHKLWHDAVRDKEVDVVVSRLRRHLGQEAASLIAPIRSRGYCLALPSSPAMGPPRGAAVAYRLHGPPSPPDNARTLDDSSKGG